MKKGDSGKDHGLYGLCLERDWRKLYRIKIYGMGKGRERRGPVGDADGGIIRG